MDMIETEVLVVGGGPAGLAAALQLANVGIDVALVDKTGTAAPAKAADVDPRATALLAPSVAVLRDLGLGAAIDAHGTALRVLELVDADRNGDAPRRRAPFDAGDLDRDAFGVAIPAADLRGALAARVDAHPNIRLEAPVQIAHLAMRDDRAIARLRDGRRIAAGLVVAADGRDSPTRAALGVRARRIDYGQRAMAFIVSHEAPHDNISIEVHRTGGPFTLVPHSDGADGRPRSSVVWMETTAAARRFEALDPDAFSAAATERSLKLIGPLRLVSTVAAWPVITAFAERLYGKRGVVLGEAAHVAPPIGAQGLNLSLADGQALARILSDARAGGRDFGSSSVGKAYERARAADVAARLGATAALNIAARGAARPIRDLRKIALGAIYDAPGLRRAAMRFGLGAPLGKS